MNGKQEFLPTLNLANRNNVTIPFKTDNIPVQTISKIEPEHLFIADKDSKPFVAPITNNKNSVIDIGYHKYIKERSKELKRIQPELDGDERLKICRDEWREIKSNVNVSSNRELTSDYHKFMSARLRDIKKSDPNIKHKDAFRQSASEWTSSKMSAKEKETVVTEDDSSKKVNYYSKYLSEYVPIYRKMHPELKHTDSFRLCVSKWKDVKNEYIKKYNKEHNIVDESETIIKNIDISLYRPPTIVNNNKFTPPAIRKYDLQPTIKVVPIHTNRMNNISVKN